MLVSCTQVMGTTMWFWIFYRTYHVTSPSHRVFEPVACDALSVSRGRRCADLFLCRMVMRSCWETITLCTRWKPRREVTTDRAAGATQRRISSVAVRSELFCATMG